MKNRVAIINIYFGKLPVWFQLWLNSCKYNKKFTWIIFTDDNTNYDFPENVKRNICTINDIKKRISNTIELNIKIDNPYKLCDFKTIYGLIFNDMLYNYTHWGYCDLDMIFGDLSKYITDDILDKYDRVLNKGHLTIFKNNDNVNNYFKLQYSGINYKEVFESKYHYGFDESAGLDKLYKENNLSQYIPKTPIIADINYANYVFKVNGIKNYKKQYFMWENGCLIRHYLVDGDDKYDEFAYIHFQKRKMITNVNSRIKYTISPRGIFESDIPKELYKYNSLNLIKQILKEMKYFKIVLQQKIYRLVHWELKI